MQYFLDTVDTIPDGLGFTQYGALHLAWLIGFVAVCLLCCLWYRRLGERGRNVWKKTVALMIIGNELFKMSMLMIGGRYTVSYLPLHLCSINIFVIAFYAWKPTKTVGGYLYTVGIPGAIAALLFPTWTELPIANFMHLHSFTVHIELAMFPIVLAVCGEVVPRLKDVPKYLLMLVAMAVPVLGINLLLDTNFMFLMSADPGNPLYLFEQLWGNHLLGFPVLIAGVILVMFGPLELIRKLRKKQTV